MAIKLSKCPICERIISVNQLAVMHTSETFCPKKYLGRRLHSQCAFNRGISIPPEDAQLLNLPVPDLCPACDQPHNIGNHTNCDKVQ